MWLVYMYSGSKLPSVPKVKLVEQETLWHTNYD